MSTLSAVLKTTGLTVDDILKGERLLTPEECETVGIDDPRIYLRAFRCAYDLGDEFFPRLAPRGDYLMGWNHGREARTRQ